MVVRFYINRVSLKIEPHGKISAAATMMMASVMQVTSHSCLAQWLLCKARKPRCIGIAFLILNFQGLLFYIVLFFKKQGKYHRLGDLKDRNDLNLEVRSLRSR